MEIVKGLMCMILINMCLVYVGGKERSSVIKSSKKFWTFIKFVKEQDRLGQIKGCYQFFGDVLDDPKRPSGCPANYKYNSQNHFYYNHQYHYQCHYDYNYNATIIHITP